MFKFGTSALPITQNLYVDAASACTVWWKQPCRHRQHSSESSFAWVAFSPQGANQVKVSCSCFQFLYWFALTWNLSHRRQFELKLREKYHVESSTAQKGHLNLKACIISFDVALCRFSHAINPEDFTVKGGQGRPQETKTCLSLLVSLRVWYQLSIHTIPPFCAIGWSLSPKQMGIEWVCFDSVCGPLQIGHNKLRALPDHMDTLNLISIVANNNSITVLPDDLFSMTSLQVLKRLMPDLRKIDQSNLQ